MSAVTVVVVGAGGAGMAAALEAASAGANVVLVEKTDRIGGTLWLSGASISGVPTRLQREKGIEDSVEQHRADVLRIGHGTGDPALLDLAVGHAGEMIDWLETIGMEYMPASPRIAGEHVPYSAPRTYNVLAPPGSPLGSGGRVMIQHFGPALQAQVDRGTLRILLNTRLIGLNEDNGRISGVRVAGPDGETDIAADAVILTTGGYGANKALVKTYHPQFDRPLAASPAHATGDAIPIVQEHGGALINMDVLVLEPGHIEERDTPGHCTAYKSLRSGRPPRLSGDIWVNKDGNRFFAEDCTDPEQAEHVLGTQPGGVMFVVFDEPMRHGLTPEIAAWTDRELVDHLTPYPTLAALAEAHGIDPAALEATVAAYNAGLNEPDPLGRQSRPKAIETAPFYCVRSDGTIVLTFGGLAVDGSLRVRRTDGTSFPNLYAAGEVIGGAQVMGDSFVSGMSAGPAFTLGRQAARIALGTSE